MGTSLENLEEIKALFLLNKHDNDLVSKLLTKLQSHEGLSEYTQYASIITLFKISLTKQQFIYMSDRWQAYAYFTKTGGKKGKC